MVLLIIIPMKNGYYWEYTQHFQTNPYVDVFCVLPFWFTFNGAWLWFCYLGHVCPRFLGRGCGTCCVARIYTGYVCYLTHPCPTCAFDFGVVIPCCSYTTRWWQCSTVCFSSGCHAIDRLGWGSVFWEVYLTGRSEFVHTAFNGLLAPHACSNWI